jgi:hypothetical protein
MHRGAGMFNFLRPKAEAKAPEKLRASRASNSLHNDRAKAAMDEFTH